MTGTTNRAELSFAIAVAIPHHGKLLLIERAMPERFEACPLHHAIARADLTMLVEFGGREPDKRRNSGICSKPPDLDWSR